MPEPAVNAHFPAIDARHQSAISGQDARFFRYNGLLIARNVLPPAELEALRREMDAEVERAQAGTSDPDYAYKRHEASGRTVPYRVEYVVDKSAAARALLGHPFVLRSIERLQGPSFVPTWDSMVFKLGGAGAIIDWHRDDWTQWPAELPAQISPAVNVDIYLDDADEKTCVWGILGSNRWPPDQSRREIARRNAGGFLCDGAATPLPMRAGDVLFHDVCTIHGSPATESALRRVLYYEFRPAELEELVGPHTGEYVPRKQQVLAAALRARLTAPYAAAEVPFEYRPAPRFAPSRALLAIDPPVLRVPHEDYWRGEVSPHDLDAWRRAEVE